MSKKWRVASGEWRVNAAKSVRRRFRLPVAGDTSAHPERSGPPALQPAFPLATRHSPPATFFFVGMAVPMLFLVAPIHTASPVHALWTFPLMLLAAVVLAWAAETAQFFVAQGMALAVLAWLQTLPEFAVEAVIAWKQQTDLMVANLTGALRLLTGLGWPMIYFTAAFFYRRRTGKRLNGIRLQREHAVEVVGLIPPIAYFFFIYLKGRLELYDGVVLAAIYCAYLWFLQKMPHRGHEEIDDLEAVPKRIMQTRPPFRGILIVGLFLAGGVLIYIVAEPFLASLLAIAWAMGIPAFVSVQWIAPFLSEFPEKVSAFYWARTVTNAPIALMNMVSSNVNQWTMLPALLPVVYCISMKRVVPIVYGAEQELEILMTIGQALVAMMLLMNMRLEWWEATGLFVFWLIQFAFSPFAATRTIVSWSVTVAYFVWFAVEVIKNATGRRQWRAIRIFRQLLREHA